MPVKCCSPRVIIISCGRPKLVLAFYNSGNAIQTIKSNDPIKVITVRPTAFPAAEAGGSASQENGESLVYINDLSLLMRPGTLLSLKQIVPLKLILIIKTHKNAVGPKCTHSIRLALLVCYC